jgi:hypothetical protein
MTLEHVGVRMTQFHERNAGHSHCDDIAVGIKLRRIPKVTSFWIPLKQGVLYVLYYGIYI